MRILDLADRAGALCGRLFSDLGAEVIKIEPPTGAASRTLAPFAQRLKHDDSSLQFTHFNAGKKSVVLDLFNRHDKQIFLKLVKSSDVLIDSLGQDEWKKIGLSYDSLEMTNPQLIITSITDFGLTGPYSLYKGSGTISSAMGGIMYLCGEKSKPPLAESDDQSYQLASAYAAFGTLVAIHQREQQGTPQRVEISCQEAQATMQHIAVNYASNTNVLEREGSRTPIGGGMPYGVYPTKDGFCHIVVIPTSHWTNFVDWIGSPDALTDPIWKNRHLRIENKDLIEHFTTEFTITKTKAELFHDGQRHRITVAPINTPREFIDDPNTKVRKTFSHIKHPVWGLVPMVRPPFRFSETQASVRGLAPKLGEHTREILSSLKVDCDNSTHRRIPDKVLPLSGFRILDFSQAIAGPVLTQLLAQFGAEVIKVESSAHQQRGRSSVRTDPRIRLQQKVTFADVNRNKLSITVNLATAQGRDLIRKLVPHCDVIVENFSPRVMENWKLNYNNLCELKRNIVLARLPGFGLTGPYKDYIGLAAVAMGMTGMYSVWDYPDDSPPTAPPVWVPDYLSAAFGATAIMAALRHRDLTGRGQLIELSQVDSTAYIMGPHYLEQFFNNQTSYPIGNGHLTFSPHGTYRCAGENSWCVISVENEIQWESFKKSVNRKHRLDDSKFSTVESRIINRSELDRYINEWSSGLEAHNVMKILQENDIPCGVVQNGKEVFYDKHLRDRNFYTSVDYSATGPIDYPDQFLRLSKTPGKLNWCSEMGADNYNIFGDLLGMPEAEIRNLENKGILE